MKKELILKEIFDQNKHWKGDNSFFEGKKRRRKLYFEILPYLQERQILSICGLRRTGKTVILKQLIDHLINEQKIYPKNIFFISFDEALLSSRLTLKDYLDVFLEEISQNQDKKFIFIDEIQYIKNWQHILKRYYDANQNIKFFISGSSSLFLKRKSTESLAGRIYEFKLNYLNFEEFLELSDVDMYLLDEYKDYSFGAAEKELRHSQKEYEVFLAKNGKKLENLFQDYLFFRQFPEMANQKDEKKIARYIVDSIYKKTIEYDIPRIFGVDKIDELKFIYQVLIGENSHLLEYKSISNEAGIEENTLKKYLHYFEESFLLDIVYNYSKSFRRSRRLQKKSYIASANFFSAFHQGELGNSPLREEYLGKLAENYIFHALKDKFQYISFFKKNQEEADFIAGNDFRNKAAANIIEVKYVNSLKWEDISFLHRLSKNKFKNNFYFVYSKNCCQIDKNKIILPCFLVK